MSPSPRARPDPRRGAEGQRCPQAPEGPCPSPRLSPRTAAHRPAELSHPAASLPQRKQTAAGLRRDKGRASTAQGAKSPAIKSEAAAPRQLPPPPSPSGGVFVADGAKLLCPPVPGADFAPRGLTSAAGCPRGRAATARHSQQD